MTMEQSTIKLKNLFCNFTIAKLLFSSPINGSENLWKRALALDSNREYMRTNITSRVAGSDAPIAIEMILLWSRGKPVKSIAGNNKIPKTNVKLKR